MLLFLWATINGTRMLIRSIINIFSGPYMDKLVYRENMHYLELDANMEYSNLENGQTLDEQGRIGSNLSLAHFADNYLFSLLSKIVQICGYAYILAKLYPLAIILISITIFLNSLISQKKVDVDYSYQQTIAPHQRRFAYLFRVLTEYGFAKETRINHADTWIQSKFETEQQEYIKQHSMHQKNHFKLSVITGLCEQTIPFIRYKLGDKAILRDDSCACGAKEKYIDLIGTRNTDWISTPNGKICTTVLIPIVSLFSKGKYEFVDQFQIVQNDIKEFAIYIATKQSIPNEFKTHIHNLLCEIIGYPIQLDFIINEKFYVNKNSLKMSWFFNKLL